MNHHPVPPLRPSTRQPLRARTCVRTCLAWAAGATVVGAHAAQIDVDNPDWSLRFDNTVKASTIYRLHDADDALTSSFNASGGAQAVNFNAGDQNFRKRGFASERLDLLSEFDAVYKRTSGLRLSGAGWYDYAYSRSSDAPNDPTNGQTPYNRFPDQAKNVAGRKAELLDAFVFGSTDLGRAGTLSARLGQHTLLYGESLFFGDNAVAAAQGPVDIQKALSSPNAQFKEIALPVPQLSGQWQVQPSLSVGAYLQFRWKESRVPPAGSYFSTANIPWGADGPEYVSLPAAFGPSAGNYVLTPGTDEKPRNGGQYGFQLKWRVAETDLGFYYAKYHDKYGQLFGRLNTAAPATDSRWFYLFGSDIKVAGLSASRSIGDFNVSAEVSVRDNMPLIVNNALYFGPSTTARPVGPTGRTAHLNLSALGSFGPNWLAQESSLVAEFAWNRALSVNDPDGEIDAGRTRDASILQFIYTPSYRQVLSGLDIGVPIGLQYSIDGRSSVTAWGAHGTGKANIGIEGNYLNVWQFGLTYTHYIGAAIALNDYASSRFGSGNALADRDYVSLNVRRTF